MKTTRKIQRFLIIHVADPNWFCIAILAVIVMGVLLYAGDIRGAFIASGCSLLFCAIGLWWEDDR